MLIKQEEGRRRKGVEEEPGGQVQQVGLNL